MYEIEIIEHLMGFLDAAGKYSKFLDWLEENDVDSDQVDNWLDEYLA